jgi:hypothetical protein
VFTLADDLAMDIYRVTEDFPIGERFVLQVNCDDRRFRSRRTS